MGARLEYGGWHKKLIAANIAAKDFRTKLSTGARTGTDDPLVEHVMMERVLLKAGYAFADLQAMNYTEFMSRYMILKELNRGENNSN